MATALVVKEKKENNFSGGVTILAEAVNLLEFRKQIHFDFYVNRSAVSK